MQTPLAAYDLRHAACSKAQNSPPVLQQKVHDCCCVTCSIHQVFGICRYKRHSCEGVKGKSPGVPSGQRGIMQTRKELHNKAAPVKHKPPSCCSLHVYKYGVSQIITKQVVHEYNVNPWEHNLGREKFSTQEDLSLDTCHQGPTNVCWYIAHLVNMQLDFIASGANLLLHFLFSFLICQGKSMGNVKQA